MGLSMCADRPSHRPPRTSSISHFEEAKWTRMLYTSLAHTRATPTTSLRLWVHEHQRSFSLTWQGRLLLLTTTEENKSSGVTIAVDTLNSSSYYLIFIFRFSLLKSKHPPGVVSKGHGGGGWRKDVKKASLSLMSLVVLRSPSWNPFKYKATCSQLENHN